MLGTGYSQIRAKVGVQPKQPMPFNTVPVLPSIDGITPVIISPTDILKQTGSLKQMGSHTNPFNRQMHPNQSDFGCFFNNSPAPIVAVYNDCIVNKGRFLTTRITHILYNSCESVVNAVYKTPKHDGSFIKSVVMLVDGVLTQCKIEEKTEAIRQANEAHVKGDMVNITKELRPDIVVYALGNIPPNSKVELEITYNRLVSIDGKVCNILLPAHIGYRYKLFNAQEQEIIRQLADTSDTVYKVHLLVEDVDIADITSNKEVTISYNEDRRSATVDFELFELPKDDLVVNIKMLENPCPLIFQQKCDKLKGESMENCAVLSAVPYFEVDQEKSEIIIIQDRSGSMGGGRMQLSIEALIILLNSLPSTCYFNIISFGTTYEMWKPTSVPYTKSNFDSAIQYVKDMKANFKCTEILQPLQHVMTQPRLMGYSRQIILLTDGQVNNERQIIDFARLGCNDGGTRIFTLGIGTGVSTYLIEGVARSGNGVARLIKDGDALHAPVIGQLERALSPIIEDLEVIWNITGYDTNLQQTPNKPKLIYNGNHFIACVFYPDGCKLNGVTLRGKINGVLFENTIVSKKTVEEIKTPFVKTNATDEETKTLHNIADEISEEIGVLHTIAAGHMIRDLEENTVVPIEAKEKIVQISKTFGLLSQQTCFIAVKHINKEDKIVGIDYQERLQQQTPQIEDEYDGVRTRGGDMGLSAMWSAKGGSLFCVEKAQQVILKDDRTMEKIITFKEHDGSFRFSDELLCLLELSKEQILQIVTDLELNVIIVCSAAAYIFLKEKHKDKEAIFRRALKMTDNFLLTSCGSADKVQTLIAAVKKLIN